MSERGPHLHSLGPMTHVLAQEKVVEGVGTYEVEHLVVVMRRMEKRMEMKMG